LEGLGERNFVEKESERKNDQETSQRTINQKPSLEIRRENPSRGSGLSKKKTRKDKNQVHKRGRVSEGGKNASMGP